MKLFQKKTTLIVVIVFIAILCGYVFVSQNTFEYTNLVDNASRDYARSILEEAGISEENVGVFFQLVNEFYQGPYSNTVESGFQKALIPIFSYEETDAIRHLEVQPDNSLTCRMAAFILVQDIITFPHSIDNRSELEEKDPKSREVLSNDIDLLHYDLLFANLTNQAVHSSAEMSSALVEYWETAGIIFPSGSKINIIMAYGSNGDLTQNFHTGVGIQSDREIWLLEKYDPIYPYQFSCFSSEKQLVNYMKLRLAESKYAAIFWGSSCLWLKR